MNLKQFTCGDVNAAPLLIGGIGQGGQTEMLVKRFGTKWKRTPVKGVWCLESPGMQFTMRSFRDGLWDIAFYDYETVEEFRKAFEDKTHCYNAIYFQTQPGDKYTGVAVIRFMESLAVES
jgi:hypothetical protein